MDIMNEDEITIEDTEESEELGETSITDKHQKFLELSTNRIRRTAKCIDILSNLSNRSSYEYSQAEVNKMFDYLQGILDEAKEKFIEKPEKPPFEW